MASGASRSLQEKKLFNTKNGKEEGSVEGLYQDRHAAKQQSCNAENSRLHLAVNLIFKVDSGSIKSASLRAPQGCRL